MESLQDALAELEEDSFSWNGADYPCTAGETRKTAQLEDGGFDVQNDLRIVCRRNLFQTPPQRGHVISHLSASYRIRQIITAPGGFLVLDCDNESKGA